MFIAINDNQERFKILDCRGRLVAVPFQVLAHPKDLPEFFGLHVSGLGNRRFPFDGAVLPVRADLEDLDAMVCYSIRQVELITQVGRGPAALQVLGQDLLATLEIDFAEGHVLQNLLLSGVMSRHPSALPLNPSTSLSWACRRAQAERDYLSDVPFIIRLSEGRAAEVWSAYRQRLFTRAFASYLTLGFVSRKFSSREWFRLNTVSVQERGLYLALANFFVREFWWK